MDSDQDNVDLFTDAIANVRSAACSAMAAYIDGSANNLSKRSRVPQISNAVKIEVMYTSVNALDALFALVNNAGQSLSSANSRVNTSLSLPIDTLQFVSSAS